MEDPKTYQRANSVQTMHVEEILKKFPMHWKDKARILDIGCGDGSVTMNIWMQYIPENFLEIIGSDKSQACVDFALKHYENDKYHFIKLDIEEEISPALKGKFDHVISSFTLHWVHRQEAAFSNIYDVLVEDGKCLLMFLGHVKAYGNYRILSRTAKWGTDLKNVSTKFISPYHDSQDPVNEITKMMQKIGFRDINVTVHHKTHDYVNGVDEFKMLMKTLNPFETLKDKWDEFMDDYVKLDPNAGTTVYQLLVVYGVK